MPRGLPIAFVMLLALGGAACAADAADSNLESDSQDQTSGATLPLREVSGLAASDGRFVAVGDRSTKVVTFRLENGRPKEVKEHSPLGRAGDDGSQFEAVAFDGKGNVVVLAESGKVVVLDADCDRERTKTKIDWETANAFVDGRVEANSLGEGVVVISKDHLLVALEKSPTAIVELGPKGDEPRGYSAGDRSSSAFEPPNELVALAAWKIEDSHAPDLSELTIGPDGALWGLSQQDNSILRFEGTLRPSEERARVKEHVKLPSSIEGAEGLAFDGKRPVVARDRSAESKNLYVLDPIR